MNEEYYDPDAVLRDGEAHEIMECPVCDEEMVFYLEKYICPNCHPEIINL